jgi:hypothetical protein
VPARLFEGYIGSVRKKLPHFPGPRAYLARDVGMGGPTLVDNRGVPTLRAMCNNQGKMLSRPTVPIEC